MYKPTKQTRKQIKRDRKRQQKTGPRAWEQVSQHRQDAQTHEHAVGDKLYDAIITQAYPSPLAMLQ